MIGLTHYLVVSGLLFSLGLTAVMIRKNVVAVLMGVELIINTQFEDSNPHKIIEKLLPLCPILSIHAPFFKLHGWGHGGTSLIKCIKLARDFEIPLVNFRIYPARRRSL